MIRSRERRLGYAAWIAVCIIWGTTYLGIRVALQTMPPFLMGGLRWTAAGLLLATALVVRGEEFPPLGAWRRFIIYGFLLLGIGNGGVVVGELWVPSGLTAVAIATTPFWMVGVEALLPNGEPLTFRKVFGLIVGFGGILLLVWPDLWAGGGFNRLFVTGIIAIQVACVGWAIGTSYRKRRPHAVSIPLAAAFEMIAGGGIMLIIGLVRGEWAHLSFTPVTMAAYVYLTLIGAIGGFVAYSYACEHLPMSTVSLYAYINPMIAVVLGAVLLGEPFGPRTVVALAVVLVGVTIVQRAPAARAVVVADLG
jgi:drug/metabolite transporter (DMT)-like permease